MLCFFLVKWWQEKSAKIKSGNWWGRRSRISNRWWQNQWWIFHFAAQFLPSNQCGQLAQARLIYLKKMPDFFFSSNDYKQSHSPKNWWRWMSDGWWWKNQSCIFHLKLPCNFFHQINADKFSRRAISISRKCRIFFSRQMTTNKVKVQKIDEEESQMMKKSIVNHSFKITAQFFPSNRCGQLAQARLIYLKKMPDFFFSSNDYKQSHSPKNWWRWMSDGWWWKNQSCIFHLKLPCNFFHQINADKFSRRAISISRKCRIFFSRQMTTNKVKVQKIDDDKQNQ